MAIPIDLGSWQTWALVLIVAVVILWLLFGGNRDMEVVGLTPLAPPTVMAVDGPRPLSPSSVGVSFSAPRTPLRAPLITAPRTPARQGRLDLSAIPIDETVSPRVSDPAPVVQESDPAPAVQASDPAPPVTPAVEAPGGPRRRSLFASVGEELTCTAFSELLGREIEVGLRPRWLRNPATGRNLQYDCYDPVTRTAVEYDGKQHREHVPRFQTQEEFESQVQRDQLKNRLSAQEGVRLIRVSDLVDTHDPDPDTPNGYRYNPRLSRVERAARIKDYLRRELRRSMPIDR